MFNAELLASGHQLNDNGFVVALGYDFAPGVDPESAQIREGIALIDPRFGKLVAEIVQYKTSEYYGEIATQAY